MSRMKALTSFLAMAMVVSMVSFAHAQTATPAANNAAGDAKKTAATTTKDTKAAAATTTKSTKAAAGETKKEAAAKAAEMPKYDLNTASKEDLMKIPGIGAATVEKIVAGRPWKMKSDLVKKGVMNDAMYKKASPYIIAKAAK